MQLVARAGANLEPGVCRNCRGPVLCRHHLLPSNSCSANRKHIPIPHRALCPKNTAASAPQGYLRCYFWALSIWSWQASKETTRYHETFDAEVQNLGLHTALRRQLYKQHVEEVDAFCA